VGAKAAESLGEADINPNVLRTMLLTPEIPSWKISNGVVIAITGAIEY
jgi:glycerol uptake facilitator-like aquaporin